jgi:division protein CdvB (Snf7/Vps24/ESCRT-III family)
MILDIIVDTEYSMLFRGGSIMVKFRIIYQYRFALMIQQKKIEEETDRLKDQDSILYNVCMDAVRKQNKKEAAKYASEINKLRKRVKFFYNAILAIERLVIRIDNFECDYWHEDPDGPVAVLSKFKLSVQALSAASQEISPFLSDISKELNNVSDELDVWCREVYS